MLSSETSVTWELQGHRFRSVSCFKFELPTLSYKVGETPDLVSLYTIIMSPHFEIPVVKVINIPLLPFLSSSFLHLLQQTSLSDLCLFPFLSFLYSLSLVRKIIAETSYDREKEQGGNGRHRLGPWRTQHHSSIRKKRRIFGEDIQDVTKNKFAILYGPLKVSERYKVGRHDKLVPSGPPSMWT